MNTPRKKPGPKPAGRIKLLAYLRRQSKRKSRPSFESMTSLAERAKMPRRTMYYVLRQLEDDGTVIVHRESGERAFRMEVVNRG